MTRIVSDLKKQFKENMKEEDPWEVRNAQAEKLMSSSFQLEATGTIFEMGVEPQRCEFDDVLYVLHKLYTTKYAQQYNLLPFNVDVEVLVNPLTSEVVSWLVPIIIMNVDRKALSGQIDILSPNNESLVYITDVLSWYWHKHLGGPKPAVRSMVSSTLQNKKYVVQNAALVCPLCYSQYKPPESYTNQEAKAWGYVRWLPTHFVEFHYFLPIQSVKTWVTKKAVEYARSVRRNNKKLYHKSEERSSK